MNDQPQPTPKMPDPSKLSKFLPGIGERLQHRVADSIRRQMEAGALLKVDPMNVDEAFTQMTTQLMTKTARMVQSNVNLRQDFLLLWNYSAQYRLKVPSGKIGTIG